MPNETTESKIERASQDIGECVGATLLEFAPRLAKKYDLAPGQLAVAIVVAQMKLLASAAAGVIVGMASDAKLGEMTGRLIQQFQPIIGAALEIPQ